MPNPGHEQAADDAGPCDDCRRKPRDAVGGAVTKELEQVRLGRVEDVDADARAEGRGEHQPTHRRVPEAAIDRAAHHVADRRQGANVALRCESQVAHVPQRNDHRDSEKHSPQHIGHAQVCELGDEAAGDRSNQHGPAPDGLRAAEDVLKVSLVSRRAERIHQPRLGGAGEERESQPQQDRGDRPAPQGGVDLPHEQVEQGRHEERGRTEHVRELSASRIGHDACGNLEDHLAHGEEGIRGECLRVVEPRVEQEQRVDAPDEGGRKRGEKGQDEVGPLDRSRRVTGHRATMPEVGPPRPPVRRWRSRPGRCARPAFEGCAARGCGRSLD